MTSSPRSLEKPVAPRATPALGRGHPAVGARRRELDVGSHRILERFGAREIRHGEIARGALVTGRAGRPVERRDEDLALAVPGALDRREGRIAGLPQHLELDAAL